MVCLNGNLEIKDWSSQGRLIPDRSSQDMSGQDRSRRDTSSQDWSSQDRSSQDRSRQDRSSQDRSSPDWSSPAKAGQVNLDQILSQDKSSKFRSKANKNCNYSANFQNFLFFMGLIMWISHLLLIPL